MIMGVTIGCVDFWKPNTGNSNQSSTLGTWKSYPQDSLFLSVRRRALGHNHNGHMVAILRERSGSRGHTEGFREWLKVLLAEDGVHELDDLILQEKANTAWDLPQSGSGDSHPSLSTWAQSFLLFPSVHMRSRSATNQFGRGGGSKYSAFKHKTYLVGFLHLLVQTERDAFLCQPFMNACCTNVRNF